MVTIQSVLPNPVGPDSGNEFIKLINRGLETIQLKGWTLKDASGKTFYLSGALTPGSELTLKNSETKITLNNDTDTVFLYNQTGTLADKLSYENPAEGEIVIAGANEAAPASAASSIPIVNSARTISLPPIDLTPLFTGLLFALIAGIVAGIVAKHLNAANGTGKF